MIFCDLNQGFFCRFSLRDLDLEKETEEEKKRE